MQRAKSHRAVLLGLGVLAALLTAAALWLRPSASLDGVPQRAADLPAARERSDSRQPTVETLSDDQTRAAVGGRRNPYLARSAVEALSLVESLPEGHPVRGDVLHHLTRCRPVNYQRGLGLSAQANALEAAEAAAKDAVRLKAMWQRAREIYCASVDVERVFALLKQHDALLKDAAPGELGFPEYQIRSLAGADEYSELMADPQVQADLWSYVSESEGFEPAYLAAWHLAREGLGPFGQVDVALSYFDTTLSGTGNTPERITQVRLAAAHIFMCRTRAPMCAPGSLIFLSGGRPVSDLHWQLGVEGLYRETFSPLHWRLIEQIVRDLQRCNASRTCGG